MNPWFSYDQVDWTFSGPAFNGTGFLYSDRQYDESPPHFTVHGFAGNFGAQHLHRVLWATRSQFPHLQIRCLYRGKQAEQLEELAKLNLIKWRIIEDRHLDEAEILAIERPESNRPRIHSFHEVAWHWIKQKLAATKIDS